MFFAAKDRTHFFIISLAENVAVIFLKKNSHSSEDNVWGFFKQTSKQTQVVLSLLGITSVKWVKRDTDS